MEESENEEIEDRMSDEEEEEEQQQIDWGPVLLQAAMSNNIEKVETALQRDPSQLNYMDKKGWTALLWAACRGFD